MEKRIKLPVPLPMNICRQYTRKSMYYYMPIKAAKNHSLWHRLWVLLYLYEA